MNQALDAALQPIKEEQSNCSKQLSEQAARINSQSARMDAMEAKFSEATSLMNSKLQGHDQKNGRDLGMAARYEGLHSKQPNPYERHFGSGSSSSNSSSSSRPQQINPGSGTSESNTRFSNMSSQRPRFYNQSAAQGDDQCKFVIGGFGERPTKNQH
eukprot:TRINITY_DN95429_c0_g1_i1.p1 TRINITY_DN95429_c0_g1~~TRINITY_DN95429_c0_g1_i1.p1  ORF type:complete len:157 (-),score=25.15 TRINITY_DN95429_c0_g1_i1:781-1251(-)